MSRASELQAGVARSAVALLALSALALALALIASPALSQEPADEPETAVTGEPIEVEAQGIPGVTQESPDLDAIDEILEGDAEALGGGGYTYDPGDRRDPFKSLLGGRDRPELRGPRPEGVPGLLIDELDLTGLFRTRQGWVAQVQAAAKEKSYLLSEGDELYDGDVVSITGDEVVFKQIVQDPTALKPFREVAKKLNPSG